MRLESMPLESARTERLRGIDWSRLAEPQADDYDTRVILYLAATVDAPGRRELFVRRPAVEKSTLCGGRVAVHGASESDLANFRRAIARLDLWPEAARQFRRFFDTVQVLETAAAKDFFSGSSAADAERFGSMSVTAHSSLFAAQAFVRACAHQKLRACGVGRSRARRLLDLPDGASAHALTHEVYGRIHELRLDALILSADVLGESDLLRHRRRTASKARRLREDLLRLRGVLQVDAEGAAFFRGFFDWAGRVLHDASMQVAGVDLRTGRRRAEMSA